MQLKHANQNYEFSSDLIRDYPQLFWLILDSESMGSEEKQYWLDIVPVLESGHRDRLLDILETEASKLSELEGKYSSGFAEIIAERRRLDSMFEDFVIEKILESHATPSETA